MLQRSTLNPYRYYSFFPKTSRSLLNDYDWLTSKSFSRAEKWEQNENGYVLTVEMPGFGKEDVSLKVKDNVLHIDISEDQKYSYKLSDKYDFESISASADKGVLTVNIPFKAEKMATEVEIKVD